MEPVVPFPRNVPDDRVAGRLDGIQEIGRELHVLPRHDDPDLLHGMKNQAVHLGSLFSCKGAVCVPSGSNGTHPCFGT